MLYRIPLADRKWKRAEATAAMGRDASGAERIAEGAEGADDGGDDEGDDGEAPR
jgi:hypothetical protein